ncbi:hypothetical protein QTI66_01835 [Variovorax sp. J22R133]|uniref:hypothetical protein n=1 Tax=Variovorax brevis TaxID=3053503 RepID=UPI002576EA8A|nr:hypothetical protein [Variovorax sp. J22R133]MDM0110866.1 hypothetical protein [Variovorax sp. J22R133]
MGLIGRLFGVKGAREAPRDEEVGQLVARVIELSPRLRLARGHEAQLRTGMAKALAHLRELVAEFPQAHVASATAWNADPSIKAFFASPDDIGMVLSRSSELSTFFEQAPGAQEASAVLGMGMNERKTLGVALEGDRTRSDVAQTTLSFCDHQIRICAASDDDLRKEIVRRLVDQLAIEGLSRIAANTDRREVLEQEHALLATRLRLLERQGRGMRSVIGGDGEVDAGELARLRERLEENDNALKGLGTRSEALDRELEGMCEVFAQASQLIRVTARRLRLSPMNVVLPEQGASEGHLLDLQIARVPGDPPRERAFALVRVSRGDVPKPRNLLDEAARLL